MTTYAGQPYAGGTYAGAESGPPAPPGVPTTVAGSPGSTTISLTWDAPGSGGAPTGYKVRIDGGSWIDVGLVLSHLFTGLDSGSTHDLAVLAYNADGESDPVTVTVTVPFLTSPLRFEVEGDPPSGKLRNLLLNPNGELGGVGWVTPVDGAVRGDATGSDYEIVFTPGTTSDTYVQSDPVPVTPGDYLSARINVTRIASGGWTALVQWGGLPTEFGDGWSSASDAFYFPNPTSDPVLTPTGYISVPVEVPADVRKARLSLLYLSPDAADDEIAFNQAAVVTRASSALVSFENVVDQGDWIDVLGPTHQIEIDRSQALDLGTLTASVLDSTLDPATADTLASGRAVRVTALSADSGQYVNLFTGRIDQAKVTYDTKRAAANPDDPKVAQIALTAHDPAAVLAQQPRPDGYATVDELRAVLEGTGVPWDINGSTAQITGAVVVSRNENASAVDQIAITRDSRSAYAWVDRNGVLQAWDRDELGDDPGDAILVDETRYSDLALSYDPDSLINLVVVTYLTYDPATQETVETKYGPYLDAASYAVRGERRAEFTVHGLVAPDVDPSDAVADFAAAVLAANATAITTCDGVTLPIRSFEEVTDDRVLLDQYTLVQLVNTARGFDQLLRVTGVVHRISATRDGWKWTLDLRFAPLGSVAAPQLIPPLPQQAPNPWLAPSLTNGWVNYGGTRDAGYRKLGGMVELRGVVKDGTPGTQIFQLPEGFRPAAAEVFAVNCQGGPTRLDVNPDGSVVQFYAADNDNLSLSGVRFQADG